MDALIDPRFGRAEHILVIDTVTGSVKAHDNEQNLNAAQGAGIQTAETVARLGAEVVITGHCGPKAFYALHAAGIKVVLCAEGTATQAVEAFSAGELVPTEKPDVEGHWA